MITWMKPPFCRPCPAFSSCKDIYLFVGKLTEPYQAIKFTKEDVYNGMKRKTTQAKVLNLYHG